MISMIVIVIFAIVFITLLFGENISEAVKEIKDEIETKKDGIESKNKEINKDSDFIGKHKKKLLGIIIAVLVIGLPLYKCTVIIPAGFVGVVYSLGGGIKPETLGQGMKFKSPFDTVTKYTVATEQAFLKDAELATKDGKNIVADIEISYHFETDKITELFNKYRGKEGKQILNEMMIPKIPAWTEEVTSKYTVIEVYGEKREEINRAVKEHLRNKFQEFYIYVETTNLSKVTPDLVTLEMIQNTANAEQKKKIETIKKEEAQIIAERRLIEAENEKAVKIKEAEANAQAIEMKAEAEKNATFKEAEGNERLAKSLDSKIIEYNKINKWNGTLPQVSGNGTPIIDFRER